MNPKQTKKKQKVPVFWVVVLPVCIAALIPVSIIGARQAASSKIDTFAKCQEKGGEVTKGNPDKCTIYGKTLEGKKKSLEEQYIGLSEADALAKAKKEGRPARVVMRDGKTQIVTMDLRDGRLNFTVEKGIVTKVSVETVKLKGDKPLDNK